MSKGVARIYYNWWGNAHIKNRLWVLLNPKGELEDYNRKDVLIEMAKQYGWKYQVERHSKKHRGVMTIVEKNF